MPKAKERRLGQWALVTTGGTHSSTDEEHWERNHRTQVVKSIDLSSDSDGIG